MNWSTNTSNPLALLVETERVADQVLQNKQEIVQLDKRRQSNREAKRNLEKTGDKKAWVTVGPILVKMTKEKGITLLDKGTETDVSLNSVIIFNSHTVTFSFRRSTDHRYRN